MATTFSFLLISIYSYFVSPVVRAHFFVLLIIFVFFDLAFLCRLQFVRNGSKHRDNKLVWVKKMTSHCTLECNFARN